MLRSCACRFECHVSSVHVHKNFRRIPVTSFAASDAEVLTYLSIGADAGRGVNWAIKVRTSTILFQSMDGNTTFHILLKIYFFSFVLNNKGEKRSQFLPFKKKNEKHGSAGMAIIWARNRPKCVCKYSKRVYALVTKLPRLDFKEHEKLFCFFSWAPFKLMRVVAAFFFFTANMFSDPLMFCTYHNIEKHL